MKIFDLFKKFIFNIYCSDDNKKKILLLFGLKIKFKNNSFAVNAIKNYPAIEQQLRQKAKTEKINIVFVVYSAFMFPARPLFDYLLNNKQSKYNVKCYVLPDLRLNDSSLKNQDKCFSELSEIYGNDFVVKIQSPEQEYLKNIDIVIPALPYDVSFSEYSVDNIVKSGILPAMINYGFYRSYYDRKLISKFEYALYWKVFVETQYNLDEYKKYQQTKGKNCELVGYCKMDAYRKYENFEKPMGKTIIIAPHHSIDGGFNNDLALSNFHKYAEFFLKLSALYPEVKFIFRPHPMLFHCLAQEQFWGQEKVDKYLAEMKSNFNVEYDTNGDYFETFAKSDGIIQDCGSYLVEYFYTGKPQCYMLKSPSDITDKFTVLGQKCLENCYLAYEQQHIIDFIENVIIDGNDSKKDGRQKFAEDEIMLNYPDVSEKIAGILDEIFF